MSTNGASSNEMAEAGPFTQALRAAVPARVDRELTATIVPRLAAAARLSTVEAETRAVGRAQTVRPGRRALVAVAIAVALVPLLLAGLAVAGVTVPAPARDAFHAVGISLPNQPPKTEASEAAGGKTGPRGADDVSGAAQAKPSGGNSTAAHQHARDQHQKAQGKATGHGQGNAVGLNDSTPPGQSKTPPGQSKTPHGQTETPPGQSKTPPGHAKQSPAEETDIPPGQAKTPPGQSKTPAGQSKK